MSSGAIALARRALGLTGARLRLEEKQAAAAVGQIRLAQAWSEAFSARDITAAQLLLTLEDTEDRRRYLNARATLAGSARVRLRAGDQRERQRGDRRDPLRRQRPPRRPRRRDGAGRRAGAAVRRGRPLHRRPEARSRRRAPAGGGRADAGDRGDGRRPAARLVVRGHADPSSPPPASRRRLAARWRSRSGRRRTRCGRWPRAAAAPGSCRLPRAARREKRWIAGGLAPVGTLHVDAGAARALAAGGSLLPAGVTRVDGAFERGDPVLIRAADGIGAGPGPGRLRLGRRPPHRRPPLRRDRGPARLARPRRDGAPRRPGAELAFDGASRRTPRQDASDRSDPNGRHREPPLRRGDPGGRRRTLRPLDRHAAKRRLAMTARFAWQRDQRIVGMGADHSPPGSQREGAATAWRRLARRWMRTGNVWIDGKIVTLQADRERFDATTEEDNRPPDR